MSPKMEGQPTPKGWVYLVIDGQSALICPDHVEHETCGMEAYTAIISQVNRGPRGPSLSKHWNRASQIHEKILTILEPVCCIDRPRLSPPLEIQAIGLDDWTTSIGLDDWMTGPPKSPSHLIPLSPTAGFDH